MNTRHLLAELDDQGGDIEIDYAIEIDHAIAGRNIFKRGLRLLLCHGGGQGPAHGPPAIAQAIVDHLDLEGSYFQKVEIAGPGFLNFTLGPKWYGEVLSAVEAEGAVRRQRRGQGEKVMVEFVSANPTGPMHMGNARGGVLGDTLANVLQRDGWTPGRSSTSTTPATRSTSLPCPSTPGTCSSSWARRTSLPGGGLPRRRHQGAGPGFYDEHGHSWKDKPEEERLDKPWPSTACR